MVGTLTETITQIDDAFFADILAAINGEATEPLLEERQLSGEPINLRQKLNLLIARGISFHLTADKFQIENARLAAAEDFEFLRNYSSGVLCVLQQALLTKEIFNTDPTLLEDYKVEILERELLLTDSAEEIPSAVHEAVVIQVTKEWFTRNFAEYL